MMLTEEDIVSTLSPLNGIFFEIEDLQAYAHKMLTRGRAVCTRNDGELVSYVLFYDDGPEAFISMVWTNPKFQNRGYASRLLQKLISSEAKPIALEVNVTNPARSLYRKLGFRLTGMNGSRERMRIGRRVAVMQPYTYPYIGYFQLVNASDLFVFYDDVNYIKRGRINRNNILLNGEEFSFTVPVADASQNRLIKDIRHLIDENWKETFFKRLTYAYKKAPYFNAVMEGIKNVLDERHSSIADLAIASIVSAYQYMGEKFSYVRSSNFAPETLGMEKSERLIAITKKADGERYVNRMGGVKLYDKGYFMQRGVELSFLESGGVEYGQFGDVFVPDLSIIDVMMFNNAGAIREFCRTYSIV